MSLQEQEVFVQGACNCIGSALKAIRSCWCARARAHRLVCQLPLNCALLCLRPRASLCPLRTSPPSYIITSLYPLITSPRSAAAAQALLPRILRRSLSSATSALPAMGLRIWACRWLRLWILSSQPRRCAELMLQFKPCKEYQHLVREHLVREVKRLGAHISVLHTSPTMQRCQSAAVSYQL